MRVYTTYLLADSVKLAYSVGYWVMRCLTLVIASKVLDRACLLISCILIRDTENTVVYLCTRMYFSYVKDRISKIHETEFK